MLRRLFIAVAVAAILAATWIVLPLRVWYRDRRPTRFGRMTNRAMTELTKAGLVPIQVVLDVPGARTGVMRSTVLVAPRLDGVEYLVSMLGERSEWVRNVRAAEGAAVLRHGRRSTPVRLGEVPVSERAPVLKEYCRIAPGGRRHFPCPPGAPLDEFHRIAAEYPVFRVASVG
jgi:hypothetical protein